jgi:hypothetical protein
VFGSAAGFRNRVIRMYDVNNSWKVTKNVEMVNFRWTITDTAISHDNDFLFYCTLDNVAFMVCPSLWRMLVNAAFPSICPSLLFVANAGFMVCFRYCTLQNVAFMVCPSLLYAGQCAPFPSICLTCFRPMWALWYAPSASLPWTNAGFMVYAPLCCLWAMRSLWCASLQFVFFMVCPSLP